MSSIKEALELTIESYLEDGRRISSGLNDLTLFQKSTEGLVLTSKSNLLDAGSITIRSGSSVEGDGGDVSITTGITEQNISYTSGNITIKTGDSSRAGYIWMQAGSFSTAYNEPSYGEAHLVSSRALNLRSGGDIVMSPMPYDSYASSGGGSVLISGQSDTIGANPGAVTIRGGDQASVGTSNNKAGSVYIQSGKANGGLEGTNTWAGDISLTAYGVGGVRQDAYALDYVARGLFSIDTTTRDSNDDSASVYISTGDGLDASSSSGNISIKTGEVTGVPNLSEVSSSGDVTIETSGSYGAVVGSITLTTGDSVQGAVGDIELTVGGLSDPVGTAGSLILQGGSGSNGSDAGGVYLYGGGVDSPDSSQSSSSGSIRIEGGGVSSVDWANLQGASFKAGSVFLSGGDVDDTVDGVGKVSIGGSVIISGGDGGIAGGGTALKGNVTIQDCYDFGVTSISTVSFNTTAFAVVSDSVVIASSGADTTLTTTNSNDIQLSPDGEIKLDSTSVTAGAENLLLGLASDNVLKSLGISLLGSGTVSFTLPFDNHIHTVPIFFGAITYNNSVNDILMGASTNESIALYPETTETYTGIRPITGSVLNYPNIKVMVSITADSNLIEVESGHYLVTTPSNISGYYYLELRFCKSGNHSSTDGINNTSVATDVAIKIQYVAFA